MRRVLGCVLGLGLACQASPAFSREPQRLRPVEPWNLHYAADSCRLARPFGTGKDQIILVLDQYEPGDWFRLMFVGEKLPGGIGGLPKGTVRFGPNEGPSELSLTAANVGTKRALIVDSSLRIVPLTKEEEKREDHSNLAPIGEAREAAATWVELKKVYRDLILETGSMAKPLAALRECSWATVKSWGLNVDQQMGLTRKAVPKGSASDWLNPADYPTKMLRDGYQGIVNFRMIVDADGRATSCHIQESTQPKEFDDVVCKAAMKRARFEPALDAQGRPAPSWWQGTVRFVLAG